MKQEIHFVTGKGGVGKSVVAAALALKLSQAGKKVLLVELGDQSFFRDFFSLSQVGFQPVSIRQNLSIALWSGDTCLREYAGYLIKVESLAKLFFDNAVMRAFINVAPALPELAILGKITSGPRKHGPPLPFDCIVVDAFATGHFKALLEAPKGMAQAVQFGPMGEQSRSIDKVIRDKSMCHYHIVTLPEELPLKEAAELSQDLKDEFDINAEIILNKILPVPISVEKVTEYTKQEDSDMKDFAIYLQHHMQRQTEMLAEAEKVTTNLRSIPLFFEADPWKLTSLMAEKL
ncbi:ArsA-related P-loop ATPase [Bdellovibrio sp. NC01]|uniref:ArsA family ATPase n=1 Tax=Bdellovibrio sp. NC01 TaxID=2220073 RepID=UPI001158F83B|nr:ArsA-related P-loop ATPase [Bdellovibrio sp. NC01]QDK39420.1 arsenical pump-driving ATPase [Bdellovibrio sp. NC01]